MKKMMKMCCAAALLALCGCVSFEYEGNREPNPTSDVQVYTDATRIDRPYQVLGRASASGSYLDVSREKLQAKLVSEARKHGADAILITEQQVVSDGAQRNAPLFESAFDYDDTSRSWRQISLQASKLVRKIVSAKLFLPTYLPVLTSITHRASVRSTIK